MSTIFLLVEQQKLLIVVCLLLLFQIENATTTNNINTQSIKERERDQTFLLLFFLPISKFFNTQSVYVNSVKKGRKGCEGGGGRKKNYQYILAAELYTETKYTNKYAHTHMVCSKSSVTFFYLFNVFQNQIRFFVRLTK